MQEEMNQMVRLKVFKLVKRPTQNVVSCRWVFTYKNQKPKARLVARGFTQEPGIDYYATFAPVALMDFVRFLFSIAAVYKLTITQCDVKTAFLYGELNETIFMEQPDGFDDGSDRVWHLQKSLYGLKQAPRCWGERFSSSLRNIGLRPTAVDPCIFYRFSPIIIMAIYVDDAVIFAESKQDALNLIKRLQKEFDVHLITSSKFLGFNYIVHVNGDISLHQSEYIVNVLKKQNMWDSNPVCTPIALCQKEGNMKPFEDNTKFREIVGALQYAACQTRPDIAYAVGLMSRKVTKPTLLDFQILKRILRYLRGTIDFGIHFSSERHGRLITFSDSDFAGDLNSYRSTSGCVTFFGGGPISWRSKLQSNVTTSTTEAEYVAVESAIKSTVCIKELGRELKVIPDKPVPIFCDNKGAVLITSNDTSVQRTRHMGAKLHYSREQHQNKVVEVKFVRGSGQLADMFTKSLSPEKFDTNRGKILTRLNITLTMLAIMISCVYAMEQPKEKEISNTLEKDSSPSEALEAIKMLGKLETKYGQNISVLQLMKLVKEGTKDTLPTSTPESTKIGWEKVEGLDDPVSLDLPGFEKVKVDEKEDTIVFKRIKPAKSELGNATLIFPTFHFVETGRRGLELRNRVRDFCTPYDEMKRYFAKQSIAYELVSQLQNHCNADSRSIIQPAVSRLRHVKLGRIRTKRLDIDTSSVRDFLVKKTEEELVSRSLKVAQETGLSKPDANTEVVKLNPSPEIDLFEGRDTAQAMNAPSFWFQLPLLWLLKPIGDRVNDESAYNLPFAHEQYFKKLQTATNQNTRALTTMLQVNRENMQTLQGLIHMLNGTNDKLVSVVNNMPNFLRAASIVQIGIQRYADLLDIVRQDLKDGKLNIPAAQQLGWIKEDESFQSTEDTNVVSVMVFQFNEIRISLTVPRRDQSITIYKIVPFKQWLDILMFMQYTGPEYMMHNKSSNCSSFIKEPKTLKVNEYCLTENKSISLDDGVRWTKVDLGKMDYTERLASMNAEVFAVGEKHYVNCYWSDRIIYSNNSVLASDQVTSQSLPCKTGPHLLDSTNNYTVIRGSGKSKVTIYNYEFTVVMEVARQDLQPLILDNKAVVADDGFNQMMQKTLNHLSAAQYYNDEAEKSWLGTESVAKYIRDNAVSAGVSLSTLIVILLVACVTLKFLKKSDMTRLVEASIKRDIVRSNSVADVSSRRESGPTPSISMNNITIGTSPNTPSGERHHEFYPMLPRAMSMMLRNSQNDITELPTNQTPRAITNRAPTPYHNARTPETIELGLIEPTTSNQSSDSGADRTFRERLSTALRSIKPTRLNFPMIRQGSTVSLPTGPETQPLRRVNFDDKDD